jgi:L-amino acid N-acyltransferase YncA
VIRPAEPSDAEQVAANYTEVIPGREATFQTRERTAEDVLAWFDDGLPFLVAADGRRVLGFAKLAPYSDTCVYAGVAGHAVYVAGDARRRGVGRALLEAVCAAAERHGFYKVTSMVFATNAASRAAHRAAGFTEVGVQRRHGRLDGAWRDVVLVERLVGEALD